MLLGSLALIEREVAAGSLIRLPEPSVRMESGYWLTWPASDAGFKDHQVILAALCESKRDSI